MPGEVVRDAPGVVGDDEVERGLRQIAHRGDAVRHGARAQQVRERRERRHGVAVHAPVHQVCVPAGPAVPDHDAARRLHDVDVDVRSEAHPDALVMVLQLHPAAVFLHHVGAGTAFFQHAHRRGLARGHAPREVLVVAERHAGRSRERAARDVDAGRARFDEPPDAGDPDVEVRIVREHRFAHGGAIGAHDPRIAPDGGAFVIGRAPIGQFRQVTVSASVTLSLSKGAPRPRHCAVQRWKFRDRASGAAVRRYVVLRVRERIQRFHAGVADDGAHRVADHDVVGLVVEVEHRCEADGERVLGLPRFEAREQRGVFGRRGLLRRGCVDAVGERGQHRAFVVARVREHTRGELADRIAPHPPVDAHEVGAEHLGEPPVDVAPRDVHLKEPVARHRVAFGDEQIVHGTGANVRHAARVASDRRGPVERDAGLRAVDVRDTGVRRERHAAGIQRDEKNDRTDQRAHRERSPANPTTKHSHGVLDRIRPLLQIGRYFAACAA